MTRRERILAAIGAMLLAAGAYFVSAAHGGSRYFLLNAGKDFPAVPILRLEPSAPPLHGSIVVIHGLGANRVVMLTLGQRLAAEGFRVYLFDGPGHGNNTSQFSFARSASCAAAVIEALSQQGEIDLGRTVLLGHSMGGGIAVLVGSRFQVAGTIAVAPAPEVLPVKLPANFLVISPQFDVPAIRRMGRELAEKSGGTRELPQNFANGDAFREMLLKGRTHTGVIFDPTATAETARWAAAALGTAIPAGYAMRWGGLAGGLLGFVGLGFLYPLLASIFAKIWNVPPVEHEAESARPLAALVYWTFSAVLAVGVLTFWVPFHALHLYSGDYLASLAALASVPLLMLLTTHWRSEDMMPMNTLGMASSLAFVTFLVFGAWLNCQLADGWMNAARWARFPFLACILLPYCLAEELALGAPAAARFGRRAARFGLYLSLRFILWIVAAYALFAGLSGAVLVVFFIGYLALFSIGQRLGADAVRRRTGSAAAAALFSAILGAWFVAAAFPLT